MGNIFILISILLNVAGQTVLKSGVNKLGSLSFDFTSIFKAFTSPLVIGGLTFYLASSVFWILALSREDLSYAYPMLSVGYLIIIITSWLFLGEQMNLVKMSGVIFISFGVFLIFKSGVTT